eukprot:SAG11_NODE_687_length_7719_cov_1.975328_1_plen_75_part_00
MILGLNLPSGSQFGDKFRVFISAFLVTYKYIKSGNRPHRRTPLATKAASEQGLIKNLRQLKFSPLDYYYGVLQL